MVEKTKVKSPTVNTSGPTTGRSLNAALVSAAPLSPFVHSPELTSTRPVMAHTTTVSRKVPVEETSAWRTDVFVCAAAATMGALPRPDSLEKRPRAEGLDHHRRDRVGLHHVADAEGGDRGEGGEHDAEPAHVEAALERVHRPTRHRALRRRDAVLDGEHSLSVLGCDPEDAGEPH